MRPTASKTFDPDQEQRRCPRQRVSWLVTVAAGSKSFQGLTRDVSATGAKILLKERPALGAEVSLAFRPPGRRPIATRALVWRVDPDGLACTLWLLGQPMRCGSVLYCSAVSSSVSVG